MFQKTDVITILGKRNSGKTTLARYIQTDRAFPRKVIFDRLGEYSNLKGESCVFFCRTFDQFAELIKATLEYPAFTIVFQFDVESDNHDSVFNEAMRLCYYRRKFCSKKNSTLCLVIDEIHNFATPHHIPKWLREAILTGRHQGLSLIACSQRPANVNKNIISQSHHVFCSNFSESNDLNYLRGIMGENVERLRELHEFHFLHLRDREEPQVFKVEKIN